jgi:DNA-directed RNA polymerase subunit K/omega
MRQRDAALKERKSSISPIETIDSSRYARAVAASKRAR